MTEPTNEELAPDLAAPSAQGNEGGSGAATTKELLATVRAGLGVVGNTRTAWEALDILLARLEAAERRAESNGENWRLETKRRMAAEREVERLRGLCERIADVLPDPMHPAFPREFVDKQVEGVVLLDAALAEEK
jgi:hypothetical protein